MDIEEQLKEYSLRVDGEYIGDINNPNFTEGGL